VARATGRPCSFPQRLDTRGSLPAHLKPGDIFEKLQKDTLKISLKFTVACNMTSDGCRYEIIKSANEVVRKNVALKRSSLSQCLIDSITQCLPVNPDKGRSEYPSPAPAPHGQNTQRVCETNHLLANFWQTRSCYMVGAQEPMEVEGYTDFPASAH
jgi:hypothetical protein